MPKKPTEPVTEPVLDVNDLKTIITITYGDDLNSSIERAGHLSPDHIVRIVAAWDPGLFPNPDVQVEDDTLAGTVTADVTDLDTEVTSRAVVASFTWQYQP